MMDISKTLCLQGVLTVLAKEELVAKLPSSLVNRLVSMLSFRISLSVLMVVSPFLSSVRFFIQFLTQQVS